MPSEKIKNKTTDSEIPFMIQKKTPLKRQKVNNWILGVRVGKSINCKMVMKNYSTAVRKMLQTGL